MIVLVAGSSGLLGRALVAELRAHGHQVRRLVRRDPAAGDEHRWNPPAGTIDEAALDGVDAVVNLCGSPMTPGRWSHARKQEMKDSRIEPTEVLAEAVAERGIATMVNASGIDYYGDTGGAVVDESAAGGSGFLAELTTHWEQATQAAERAGARVVRLRTGVVLSGHGGMLRYLTPLVRFGLGGRLGDGTQYVPWISLPDHAAATRFAVEQAAVRGPVNVVAPHPVTNTEFVRQLGARLHRPTPWFVPKQAMRLLLGPDAVEPILNSHNARPKALLDAGFTFRHEHLHQALAAVV
uniref:TIGR01777 family protein n=1 Tax=Thermocrispum agreste TaxID=37925 RepID=A0A2W4J622_9PSEU|nr:MAG: TIGR01777 family protein [Thermocrispum agreste]